MSTKITPHDLTRIAAAAGCDTKTVRRYYRDPASVRSTTSARLAKAARHLGLSLPMQVDPLVARPEAEPK
jgi:DNA-binding LacI/PurR family transcriptional regulator